MTLDEFNEKYTVFSLVQGWEVATIRPGEVEYSGPDDFESIRYEVEDNESGDVVFKFGSPDEETFIQAMRKKFTIIDFPLYAD